jgi:uncharacterized integral membrane protein
VDDLEPLGTSSVEHKKESRSQVVRLVVGAVLGVALILFVVQNTQSVQLNWLTFTFQTQQWILLVIVAAITLGLANVVGHLVRRGRRRRKGKRSKDDAHDH